MATHFAWNSVQMNQSSKENLSYVVSKLSPSLSSASFDNWLQTSLLRKMLAYLFLKQSTLSHYECKHVMLWLITKPKQLDRIRENREKDTPFARLEWRTTTIPEEISPLGLTAITTNFRAEMPNKLLSNRVLRGRGTQFSKLFLQFSDSWLFTRSLGESDFSPLKAFYQILFSIVSFRK